MGGTYAECDPSGTAHAKALLRFGKQLPNQKHISIMKRQGSIIGSSLPRTAEGEAGEASATAVEVVFLMAAEVLLRAVLVSPIPAAGLLTWESQVEA
jgi:hypothetical protein